MRRAPLWWRRRTLLAWSLRPLSLLYRGLFLLVRAWAVRRRCAVAVPVVVVGNLTVGGSGKTPVVAALVEALCREGLAVGVVSRGYGRKRGALRIVSGAEPLLDGDEPTLLARRTGVPVVVGADRCQAVATLVQVAPETQVVVADDGLQHHRLPRVVELVVFDPAGIGNGWLLPAGPLREPLARLASATAVLVRGAETVEAARALVGRLLDDAPLPPVWPLAIAPVDLVPLTAWQAVAEKRVTAREAAQVPGLPVPPSRSGKGDSVFGVPRGEGLPLSALRGRTVAAVAGIAAPERFFALLQQLGAEVIPYPFPDHHRFSAVDLPPVPSGGWRLFTEKDAVKCAQWAGPADYVLRVAAQLPDPLVALVRSVVGGPATPGHSGVPPL